MKKYLLTAVVMSLPFVVAAQSELSKVKNIVGAVGEIVGLLIPIVFALALLYFFWGLGKYILASGEGKEEGKNIMIWGVVALFVMASVWGIVRFIQQAFDINNNENINAPGVTNIKK